MTIQTDQPESAAMDDRRVLVASGEYEVFSAITDAIHDRGFSVSGAFSHRDVLFHLRNDHFAVLIIDARLCVLNTQEPSLRVVRRIYPRPPLVIYTEEEEFFDGSGEVTLNSLHEEMLRPKLLEALRIPVYGSPLNLTDTQDIPILSGLELEAESPEGGLASPQLPINTSIYWRDDEMRTLFALSRSLTEVLDLSEVLNRVVEAARALTNADEGMILLPDDQSDELYLRAKVGIDAQVAENFRIKTQDTLAGTVFTSAEPMLVSTKGAYKVKTQYFVNALLYVPILLNGRPLGVLGVNNRHKQDIFSQRHLELLANLASYAAIAINNARIHGDSVHRAQELKALVDASRAVNASLSLEKTLIAVCEHLARILNVQIADLYRASDADEGHAIFRHHAGFMQARWRGGNEPLISLSVEDAERLNLQEVVIIKDVHTSDEHRDLSLRANAFQVVMMPVIYGNTTFGVLLIHYVQHSHQELPEQKIKRVQRLLIDNAHLLMGGTEDRAHVTAFRLLSDVKSILDGDRIEFGLIAANGSSLRIRYAYGGVVWANAGAEELTEPAHTLLSSSFTDQQSVQFTVDQHTLPPDVEALMANSHAVSMLQLPLVVRGRPYGLAVMSDTLRFRTFARREIELARAVIGQAATAIDNAQLVIDLEASLNELKATQNRLIHSARLSAMGELAAAVAHQINNPLTTIVLDAELLLDGQSVGSRQYDSLAAILRAGKRASGVVRRLLSSARPDAGDSPPISVDVIYSIQETIALVIPYFERAGIRLVVDMPDVVIPPVIAVMGALDDIWLNLLMNAHDVLVGQPDAKVVLSVTHLAALAIIEIAVTDNGPGIPTALHQKVFDPFFTTKPQGEGTGLGLYICRQVVTKVGGDILLKSGNGKGATFVVHLPCELG